MNKTIQKADRLEGSVVLPGDKSISQRAILLNSISDGQAHISNLCEGDDRTSILTCMRGLSVEITEHSNCNVSGAKECFLVNGRGLNGLTEPSEVLNAGNSGTASRLVTGLLSGQSFFSTITGDESLRARPMKRIVQPLSQMGAQINGRDNGNLLPLSITGGNLEGIRFKQPVPSAQVKSSLLVAGLYAEGSTYIIQPSLSRDHTELMLKAMGANIQVNGLEIEIQKSNLNPVDISVPGDISSSAFWLVAGCIHPNAKIIIKSVGINPTRSGILEIIMAMGGRLTIQNKRIEQSELVADISAESSSLEATEISGDIIPRIIDELPILAVAASQAKGTTVVKDATELRVKESDRISATVSGLRQLGADIQEKPDGMIINGDNVLTGNSVKSYGDHRIAMSMAIAGLISEGKTVISGAESAAISYPLFWDTIDSISSSL